MKQPSPLVTVIVPLKDRLELLEETIASLKSQTSKSWCVLLVDDGSSDATKDYLRDLSAKDNRFRVLERKTGHSGPNACRNLGVREAISEYVVFLDSDDILSSESLGRRVNVMENNRDIDFALFSSRVFCNNVDDSRTWFRDWNGVSELDRMLRMEWPINISSPIWRRSFLLKTDLFDETLPSWDDWEMHVRILAGNPRYLRFIESDFYYRSVEDYSRLSYVQFRDSVHLESATNVFSKTVALLKRHDLLNPERCHCLAEQFFSIAFLSLSTDGVITSIKRLKKIKELSPGLTRISYFKYLIRLVYCGLKIKILRLR